jgi:hypothetical protein
VPQRAIEPRTRDTSRVTLAAAAERWLGAYVATTRNLKGQRLAWFRCRRYLRVFLGPRRLSQITGDDIRRYRLYLE